MIKSETAIQVLEDYLFEAKEALRLLPTDEENGTAKVDLERKIEALRLAIEALTLCQSISLVINRYGCEC